jgi:hypothetical protein
LGRRRLPAGRRHSAGGLRARRCARAPVLVSGPSFIQVICCWFCRCPSPGLPLTARGEWRVFVCACAGSSTVLVPQASAHAHVRACARAGTRADILAERVCARNTECVCALGVSLCARALAVLEAGSTVAAGLPHWANSPIAPLTQVVCLVFRVIVVVRQGLQR